jgi:hypothetical protein
MSALSATLRQAAERLLEHAHGRAIDPVEATLLSAQLEHAADTVARPDVVVPFARRAAP